MHLQVEESAVRTSLIHWHNGIWMFAS